MNKGLYILIFYLLISTGVRSQSLLEDLPILNCMTTKYLFSSYDPTGGNSDGFESGNYLYTKDRGSINNPDFTGTSESKEYVMVDIKGTGAVKRFWNARFNDGDTVRFYIDGSLEPTIEMTLSEIFDQKLYPFDSLLTLNYTENTGALLTYQPIFFASNLIVTIDNPSGFYQFDVEIYGDRSVTQEEVLNQSEELQVLAANAGQRPAYLENVTWDSLDFSLAAGESIELFNRSGSYTIKAIELEIEGIDNTNSNNVLIDDCRFVAGSSKFKMNVDPNASSYKIIGLQNNRTGKRRARVKINGQNKPNWFIEGDDYIDHVWKEYTYTIPGGNSINSDSLTIELEQVNGLWVDFKYWMVCDGVITDSIDVGDPQSELAHGYQVEGQLIEGSMMGRGAINQVVKNSNSDILNNLLVQTFWDGSTSAAINAPLSYFCFVGERDASITRSIAAGYDGSVFYNYFPMPFAEQGRILLKNRSANTINNIKVRIAYEAENQVNKGYLYAHYNTASTTRADNDLIILNTEGHGKVVGIVLNGDSPQISWLEGDDRIYIDKMNTPLIYGTGTEDVFGGGDYFLLGERDLPFGSFNFGEENYYNMHRNYISDPIPFRDGLLYNLQRGGDNDVRADYNSLIFYYLSPEGPLYTQQNFLNVSEENASVVFHDYHQYGGEYEEASGTYDGTFDHITVVNDGFRSIDSSEFVAYVTTNNDGMVLHRGFSYQENGQCAKVYADNQWVGDWCTVSKNEINFWGEDVFVIPPEFTNSGNPVHFKMVSTNGNWSELYYRINIIGGESNTITGNNNDTYNLIADLFPNPIRDRGVLKIHNPNIGAYDVKIMDSNGIIRREYNNISTGIIEIERGNLSPGWYWFSIHDHQDQKLLGAYRFVFN